MWRIGMHEFRAQTTRPYAQNYINLKHYVLLSVNTHITGILSYTSKVSTDFYFFSGLANRNPNMMQNDSSAFQLHDINGGYLACCNLPIDVSTFPKNPKMNTVMTPAP